MLILLLKSSYKIDMMKTYIESVLHQEIQLKPYNETSRLPLAYRSGYNLMILVAEDVECLLAKPKETTNLSLLRKQQRQLEIYTGLRCVLYLCDMNYYARDEMISGGIPFVWEGHQVYMLFIEILLAGNQRKAIPACA
mgnify:CR=1 FL=1|jgi:hypothetical protein